MTVPIDIFGIGGIVINRGWGEMSNITHRPTL